MIMKTLLLPGISFKKDPQALACLLYGLFDTAKRKYGSVEARDVTLIARDLGFFGAPGSVLRLLLNEGFLSGNSESGYWIDKENERAMDRFVTTHEQAVAPLRLSPRETVHLFRKMGSHGSALEQSALRIFRLLGTLQEELHAFPDLAQAELADYAGHEAARTVEQEHLWWLIKKINLLVEEMHLLDRSDSPEATAVMAIAYEEAYAFQMELNAGVASLDRHEQAMRHIKRTEHLVALLEDTSKIIDKLVTTIVESDSRS